MKDKSVVGKLIINIGDKPLELDILSSVLDRSHSSFNFESGQKEDIDGYNLTIDVGDLGKESMNDLTEVQNHIEKMYRVILNIDGQESCGDAIIAQNMGISGVTIDLEIHR